MIEERIRDPEQLKAFDYQGYRYSAEQSKPDSLVFLRDHSEADQPARRRRDWL